ncbi:MAG: hypothetical protein ABIH89_10980, partial [Elusimicrobiota bacterium]
KTLIYADLVQAGQLGVLQALETYNPDMPGRCSFVTWAYYSIYKEVQMAHQREFIIFIPQEAMGHYTAKTISLTEKWNIEQKRYSPDYGKTIDQKILLNEIKNFLGRRYTKTEINVYFNIYLDGKPYLDTCRDYNLSLKDVRRIVVKMRAALRKEYPDYRILFSKRHCTSCQL